MNYVAFVVGNPLLALCQRVSALVVEGVLDGGFDSSRRASDLGPGHALLVQQLRGLAVEAGQVFVPDFQDC